MCSFHHHHGTGSAAITITVSQSHHLHIHNCTNDSIFSELKIFHHHQHGSYAVAVSIIDFPQWNKSEALILLSLPCTYCYHHGRWFIYLYRVSAYDVIIVTPPLSLLLKSDQLHIYYPYVTVTTIISAHHWCLHIPSTAFSIVPAIYVIPFLWKFLHPHHSTFVEFILRLSFHHNFMSEL